MPDWPVNFINPDISTLQVETATQSDEQRTREEHEQLDTTPRTTCRRDTTRKLFKDKARHGREITTDRRLAPPPNNILTGFVMADAPSTTPRSSAVTLHLRNHPMEWGLNAGKGAQATAHRIRRPPLKLMVTPTAPPGSTYHHPTPSKGRNP